MPNPLQLIIIFYFYSVLKLKGQSSRGGLVVERWSDNRFHSAMVGSNLHQVWCINRSLEETLVERRAFRFIIHALMLAEMIDFYVEPIGCCW